MLVYAEAGAPGAAGRDVATGQPYVGLLRVDTCACVSQPRICLLREARAMQTALHK